MLCRVEVRSEHIWSLLRKMASDSAVLPLVGKSRDLAEQGVV